MWYKNTADVGLGSLD